VVRVVFTLINDPAILMAQDRLSIPNPPYDRGCLKPGNKDHGTIHKRKVPDALGSPGNHRPEGRFDAGDRGAQYGYGNDFGLDGGNGTRRGAANVSRQSAPSQHGCTLLAKKLERETAVETIAKAPTLIDPSGTLVPGTRPHNRISSTIQDWIDQCGPDYALSMAKVGSEHLNRRRKFLSSGRSRVHKRQSPNEALPLSFRLRLSCLVILGFDCCPV